MTLFGFPSVCLRALLAAGACAMLALSAASAQNAGNVDPNFNPGAGPSNPIYAIAVQSDGKIIIGGNFFYLNGYTVNGFARLNPDGGIDFSFNPRNGANNRILAVALQPDGKVLIGGAFTTINGVARSGIARLNADGSVDPSFGFYAGANDVVRSIAVQPDGQIIIGGDFTFYNNYALGRIVRLNPDGSIDFSFNPGVGASAQVGSVVLQPDGKVIVGGNFIGFNGVAANGIIRLTRSGAVDTAFGGGIASRTSYPNNYTNTVLLQPDGKILIGGGFTFVGNAVRRGVARLNADGTLDSAFNAPAGGPNGPVLAFGLQSDGKILIGGEFTGVDGIQGGSIARLMPNGVLDPSYGPIFPANGPVGAIQLLPNGETMAAGAFTFIGGLTRSFIARLFQDATVNPTNVKYLRLLSLGDKQFSANTSVGLLAEAYSPNDPVVSLTLLNNDNPITRLTVSPGDSPAVRKEASAGPVRHGQSIFQQIFNALNATLADGVNNLKVVATTQSGAQLTSNTSAIMGDSKTAAQALTCQITSPAAGALPAAGSPVQVMVTNAANAVTVDFYVDSAKQDFSVASGGQTTFTMPDLSTDRPHYLTAIVTDNVTRISKQSAAVMVTAQTGGGPTPPPIELPTVTLTASADSVTAGTGQNGEFTITRDGDVSQELVVAYTVKGSAKAGEDYIVLKGTKKMKAGKASVKLKVKPLGNGAGAGVKRVVKLTLQPSDAYNVGSSDPVKVKIFGQ